MNQQLGKNPCRHTRGQWGFLFPRARSPPRPIHVIKQLDSQDCKKGTKMTRWEFNLLTKICPLLYHSSKHSCHDCMTRLDWQCTGIKYQSISRVQHGMNKIKYLKNIFFYNVELLMNSVKLNYGKFILALKVLIILE